MEAPIIEAELADEISSQSRSESQQAQSTECPDNFPAKILAGSESSSESEDHLGGQFGGRGGVVVVSMADVHNITSGMPHIE